MGVAMLPAADVRAQGGAFIGGSDALTQTLVFQPVRRLFPEEGEVLQGCVVDEWYEPVQPRNIPSIVEKRRSKAHHSADVLRKFRREQKRKHGTERQPAHN